jgi:hypothetical protein
MVSASMTRQPSIRESTISRPAMASVIAARAWRRSTPGPARRLPSRNTISASTLGAMNLSTPIVSPLAYKVDARTGP